MTGPPKPRVLPAREAAPDLLELLVAMRRVLKERGESLPATWPEEAERELRAGRMHGWVLRGPGETSGLAILATRQDRGFGQVHLRASPQDVGAGMALLRALEEGRPSSLRRMEVALSAEPSATEGAWGELLAAPGAIRPFTLLRRQAMVRALDAQSPPAPEPLPSGLRFAPVQGIEVKVLASVDHAAFVGGPDHGLVAENPQDNERLLRGLLQGDLGPPLREASPAVLRVESTGDQTLGHLVGFSLCLEESSHTALLADIAVLPDFRRQGVGKALLARSLRGLIALGFHQVRLWVTSSNHAAIQLYVRAGFEVERQGLILQWARPTG